MECVISMAQRELAIIPPRVLVNFDKMESDRRGNCGDHSSSGVCVNNIYITLGSAPTPKESRVISLEEDENADLMDFSHLHVGLNRESKIRSPSGTKGQTCLDDLFYLFTSNVNQMFKKRLFQTNR